MKVSKVFLRAAQLVDEEDYKLPFAAVWVSSLDVKTDGPWNAAVPYLHDVFEKDNLDYYLMSKLQVVMGLLLCAELAKEDE